MNEPLSTAAKHALKDPQFESIPGNCQRFVRQVITSVYGDAFSRYNQGKDAIEAAGRWKSSPFAVDPMRGSVPGDILYYTHGHGPHGHVTIRLPGNIVAENSTVHDGPHGGKGTRPIERLGVPTLIVRLPPP